MLAYLSFPAVGAPFTWLAAIDHCESGALGRGRVPMRYIRRGEDADEGRRRWLPEQIGFPSEGRSLGQIWTIGRAVDHGQSSVSGWGEEGMSV
jgi:hypothetical protein